MAPLQKLCVQVFMEIKGPEMKRVICNFTQNLPGPLLVCIAGIHGNEHAGIKALKRIQKTLDKQAKLNPKFVFRGRILGLCGNVAAFMSKQRFVDVDMNRIITQDLVLKLKEGSIVPSYSEHQEIIELLSEIEKAFQEKEYSEIVILDLHTTSARGGTFAIPADDARSLTIAKGLHAPVIKGFSALLKGTTLDYFTNIESKIPLTALVFEAGQHDNPLSVNRTLAAIINCLRTIECMDAKDVENHHDEILKAFSEGHPKISRLVFQYRIEPEEEFVMKPGFSSFQKITENEILANNKFGEIRAQFDGYLLMPLYQSKGNDGFFIVQVEI